MNWMNVVMHGINVILILGIISLVIRFIIGLVIASK